jgi:hypothetical protein
MTLVYREHNAKMKVNAAFLYYSDPVHLHIKFQDKLDTFILKPIN